MYFEKQTPGEMRQAFFLALYFQNSRLSRLNPTGSATLYREQNEAVAVNS
jgi:hypothetical protein